MKTPYFDQRAIDKLNRSYSTVQSEYEAIIIGFTQKKFSSTLASEHANHGFSRRIGTIKHCIDNIYRICPPETVRINRDNRLDLTINLQSFVFNIFGCLDNLAWIWVKEKDLKNSNGKALRNTQIGIGEKYKVVRESFSQDFNDYLSSLDEWFYQLENFRHALAHRIPLYVPPYVVNNEEAEELKRLENLKTQAIGNHNFSEYDRLCKKQDSLGKFAPWMTHSFEENSPQVIFHSQVLCDWATIVEISTNFLDEINRIN